MVLRPICDKRCSETRLSLESMDMEYLIKLNEYLDIQDYLTDVHGKEAERESKSNHR